MARLGPSAADFIGYFASAYEAAIAVADAIVQRDEFLTALLDDEPALLDAPANELLSPACQSLAAAANDLLSDGHVSAATVASDRPVL